MRIGTKLFLMLGCAVVLALEAPHAASDAALGWRGPYARLLPSATRAEAGQLAPTNLGDERMAAAPRADLPSTRLRRRLDLSRR